MFNFFSQFKNVHFFIVGIKSTRYWKFIIKVTIITTIILTIDASERRI